MQGGRSLLASASTSGGSSNSEGVITHGFTVDAGTLHATEADGSTDDTAVVGMAIAIPIGIVALGAYAHTHPLVTPPLITATAVAIFIAVHLYLQRSAMQQYPPQYPQYENYARHPASNWPVQHQHQHQHQLGSRSQLNQPLLFDVEQGDSSEPSTALIM